MIGSLDSRPLDAMHADVRRYRTVLTEMALEHVRSEDLDRLDLTGDDALHRDATQSQLAALLREHLARLGGDIFVLRHVNSVVDLLSIIENGDMRPLKEAKKKCERYFRLQQPLQSRRHP